jgi:hypothetical protein
MSSTLNPTERLPLGALLTALYFDGRWSKQVTGTIAAVSEDGLRYRLAGEYLGPYCWVSCGDVICLGRPMVTAEQQAASDLQSKAEMARQPGEYAE